MTEALSFFVTIICLENLEQALAAAQRIAELPLEKAVWAYREQYQIERSS